MKIGRLKTRLDLPHSCGFPETFCCALKEMLKWRLETNVSVDGFRVA